jgi:hypothetical protein
MAEGIEAFGPGASKKRTSKASSPGLATGDHVSTPTRTAWAQATEANKDTNRAVFNELMQLKENVDFLLRCVFFIKDSTDLEK